MVWVVVLNTAIPVSTSQISTAFCSASDQHSNLRSAQQPPISTGGCCGKSCADFGQKSAQPRKSAQEKDATRAVLILGKNQHRPRKSAQQFCALVAVQGR